MIKHETILSSFDDKLTLLQWLQKTEKALSESTLNNFVLTAENRQLTAALSFADGSIVTSNSVPLDAQELIPITTSEIDLLF